MTELQTSYATVTAATAHEAMGRRGAIDSAIKPIRTGMRAVGRALTCSCHVGDNLTLHAALKIARPGDVIVCAAGGYAQQGLFGDVMASCAIGRGVAGLVTDGGIRDSAEIARLGFNVFSKGIAVNGTVKETFGSLNEPIAIGGQTVSPGDLVIADDDGVVVVPAAEIETVLSASTEREKKEARFREALLKGETTWDLLGLNALMESKGLPHRF